MGLRALDDLGEPTEPRSRPIDQRTAVGEPGAHTGGDGPERNQQGAGTHAVLDAGRGPPHRQQPSQSIRNYVAVAHACEINRLRIGPPSESRSETFFVSMSCSSLPVSPGRIMFGCYIIPQI